MVRVAVRFDDQSVEVQVHRLLTERCNQFAFTADMAGVANDGQVWHTATQLDSNMPEREVTIHLLVERTEPAMYRSDTVDTCSVKAFDGADPELQIGIDRVFNQHGDVNASQRIGHILHGKRIDCRPCADP